MPLPFDVPEYGRNEPRGITQLQESMPEDIERRERKTFGDDLQFMGAGDEGAVATSETANAIYGEPVVIKYLWSVSEVLALEHAQYIDAPCVVPILGEIEEIPVESETHPRVTRVWRVVKAKCDPLNRLEARIIDWWCTLLRAMISNEERVPEAREYFMRVQDIMHEEIRNTSSTPVDDEDLERLSEEHIEQMTPIYNEYLEMLQCLSSNGFVSLHDATSKNIGRYKGRLVLFDLGYTVAQ